MAGKERRNDLRHARRPAHSAPWGVTTRKGNKVYLHILNWPDPVLAMPRMPKKVKSATFFGR